MKQHNSPKKSSRRSFTKSIASSLAAAPFVAAYGPSPQHDAEATEPSSQPNTTSTILSPMVFKDHIPPMEIFSDTEFHDDVDTQIKSGSVFLHTKDNFEPPLPRSAEQPGTQVFGRNKKIIGVRVILTDGKIV